MLPDYPEFKDRARAAILRGVARRVPLVEPVLEGIRHTQIHEGRRSRLTRADDTTQDLEMHEGRALLEIPMEQMKTISQDELLGLVTRLAEQVAEHQAKTLFSTLDAVTTETGNAVSAAGIGAKEAFLESQRRLQVDFDPETLQPRNMVIVMHPDHAPKLMAAMKEWEKDPAFVAALDEIRKQQLEDWRARESARALVD